MKFLYDLLPFIFGALIIYVVALLINRISIVVDKIKNRKEIERKYKKETSPDYIKDILSYCLSKRVDTRFFSQEDFDSLNQKNIDWLKKLESDGNKLKSLAQLSDKTKSIPSSNIIPGIGTDRIKYEMDIKPLLEELLLPNRIYCSGDSYRGTESIYLSYYDHGLQICINENSKVVGIWLKSNIQYGNPEYSRDFYKFQLCNAMFEGENLFDKSFDQIEFLFGEPQYVRTHERTVTIPYTRISYKNGLSFDFRNDTKQITLIRI